MVSTKILLSIAEMYNSLVVIANLKEEILSVIRSHIKPGNLFYIPVVIKSLIKEYGMTVGHWEKELLKLEKEGFIEFQPESGMNRLNEEDKKFVIHMSVDGQIYDLTWGVLKNKVSNANQIPVIENGSENASKFVSFTRGVHSKLHSAQAAARKYMKQDDEVVILHSPETRITKEYWVVGYIKEPFDAADSLDKEAAKKKEKLDPNAGVRNRGDVCVPASKAKDKKDHFPINSLTQARNALSQVAKYTKVPPWYNGSLKSLVEIVKRKVHKKYPSIGKEKKS